MDSCERERTGYGHRLQKRATLLLCVWTKVELPERVEAAVSADASTGFFDRCNRGPADAAELSSGTDQLRLVHAQGESVVRVQAFPEKCMMDCVDRCIRTDLKVRDILKSRAAVGGECF